MLKSTKIIPNPYEEIAVFRDRVFHFNFPQCASWLENRGKDIFGSHFRIYPEDRGLLLTLLVYATGDKETAAGRGIDMKKGILLTGPVGCGKTSLMTLVNFFFPKEKQFQIKAARETGFEFEREGYKTINKYSQAASPANIFCFDDLGIEQPQKYFGNECNVMAEILLSRYDLFVSKGILTYATTNLSATELESKYGNRLRSRMREMFNLVAFDKNSKDKRG
jgi:energy-coupling factor transporter ATP-binding protein EcfA2